MLEWEDKGAWSNQYNYAYEEIPNTHGYHYRLKYEIKVT
jgi:hypothetical protein